jgi:hypothetical protein
MALIGPGEVVVGERVPDSGQPVLDTLKKTWAWRLAGRQPATRLWKVGCAVPLVVVLATLAAYGVSRWVRAHASPVAVPSGPPAVDALEVVKTTLSIALFFGAVLTGIYAYRKQRLAEADAHRSDAVEFTRRYSETLTQLGSDRAAVRIGGAYSLGRLADDWEDQRQTCIDVLCANLRMGGLNPSERHGVG